MTNRQDWHVSELAQQGISSRAYRPGPYSSREDLLYAFDRFIVSVHERRRADPGPGRARRHVAEVQTRPKSDHLRVKADSGPPKLWDDG